MGKIVFLSGVVLAAVALAAWWLLRAPPPAGPYQVAALTGSSAVIEGGPGGHAYQYVSAPNGSWDAAKAAAEKMTWHGKPGYLATIDSDAEYQFIINHVFTHAYSDVTYLGGRQTAPGEWRWVTGEDKAADGGKGRLFWRGDEQGAAVNGAFANWMASAFQHGGTWDVGKVCCVTLFSYGMPQLSTSLGTGGEIHEGVAGYLVEY